MWCSWLLASLLRRYTWKILQPVLDDLVRQNQRLSAFYFRWVRVSTLQIVQNPKSRGWTNGGTHLWSVHRKAERKKRISWGTVTVKITELDCFHPLCLHVWTCWIRTFCSKFVSLYFCFFVIALTLFLRYAFILFKQTKLELFCRTELFLIIF